MNTPVQQIISENKDKFDALVKELGADLERSDVVGSGPFRDLWLVRFLIGFDWKIPVCSEKFRTMLKYREMYKMDDVRKKFQSGEMKPQDIPGYAEHHKHYVCTFHLSSGCARDMSPINLEQTAKFNFQGIADIDARTADTYIMHNLEYHSHMCDTTSLETGCLKGYVKVMDLSGASMSHVSWVNKWASKSKERKERLGFDIMECYPEMFSKVILIHSPMFFSLVWKVVKPFIPQRTCDKVSVQSNAKSGKAMVLENVDPSVMPVEFGGAWGGDWRMKA